VFLIYPLTLLCTLRPFQFSPLAVNFSRPKFPWSNLQSVDLRVRMFWPEIPASAMSHSYQNCWDLLVSPKTPPTPPLHKKPFPFIARRFLCNPPPPITTSCCSIGTLPPPQKFCSQRLTWLMLDFFSLLELPFSVPHSFQNISLRGPFSTSPILSPIPVYESSAQERVRRHGIPTSVPFHSCILIM